MSKLIAGILVGILGLGFNAPTLAQPYLPTEQDNPQKLQNPPNDPRHQQTDPASASAASKQDAEYLEYLAAIKRCLQLSADEKARCTKETKRHYDRM